MDERQAQIRERAGLEESKLNEDFIEFLRKYGFLILLLVALVGGATTAKRWYGEYKERKVNAAFADYESARAGGDASPEVLKQVAQDHEDVRSVAMLAEMDAADAYLRGVRKGLKAGAKLTAEGQVENPDDLMSAADRESYLTKAAEMYQSVVNRTGNESGYMVTKVGALFGLAAVAESRGDYEKAKAYYTDIAKLVDGTSFAPQGAIAQSRIELLPSLAGLPKLVARADLQDLPAEPTPLAPITPTDPGAPQLNLEPVQITPGNANGGPIAVPAPTPDTTPTESPKQPEPAQPEPSSPPK